MMQFKFLVCLSSEFSSSELPSNTKLEFQACTSLMVPFWCQLIAQSSHSANSNTSPCVTPTLATARQGWDQEDWNYVKKVVVVFLNPLSHTHVCTSTMEIELHTCLTISKAHKLLSCLWGVFFNPYVKRNIKTLNYGIINKFLL